jgi:rhodanese-related sulfurtransferase
MEHSPAFLEVVNDAKSRVLETTLPQTRHKLETIPGAALVDVREDSEWQAGHIIGSCHLGKGVLERDIEKMFPNKNQTLLLYCGGGFRSALAADMAMKMGYKEVFSVRGGFKAMAAEAWPVVK